MSRFRVFGIVSFTPVVNFKLWFYVLASTIALETHKSGYWIGERVLQTASLCTQPLVPELECLVLHSEGV